MPTRFLAAEWRHLLMINYHIDPAVLQPLVPPGVELDSWNGQTFVSVVGFRFVNTRVLGVAVPFHINFDEVNLRFYVRRQMPDGPRRGVAFIKEVVPRFAIAKVARWLYNENYVALPMRSQIQLPEPAADKPGFLEYLWGRPGWSRIAARFADEPAPLGAGSQEEFIAEHYWGYVGQRNGTTMEYQVAHPPWRVWRATEPQLDCPVAAFYGAQYAKALAQKPTSAFVAEGSAIEVFRGEVLR
jgi:uncharacterized protein YqjF (DUF2071 family)